MAQITSGLKAILSMPAIYSAFQYLFGGHSVRVKFCEEFIRPILGCTVLDIGCGPADILEYLPVVDYWGFDISEAYIKHAKKKYGHRGKFHCQELTSSDVEKMPLFDIVLTLGLLHHLNDEDAVSVMRLAYMALKPGGRLLTLDPCIEHGQNPIAWFLIRNDRGHNIRTKAGYAAIASAVFDSPRIEVRHKSGIPYTHCFMECARK